MGKYIGLGVLALIVIGGIWFVSAGNKLVALDENVATQWGNVETVLQRRYDLIPNLVKTVKGYAAHEEKLLTEITQLRSQWGAAKNPAEKTAAANLLEGALGRLMVVVENYPNLKADQGFRDLQHELAGTENRINVERQRYNEALREYNTKVRQFPSSIAASMRGLEVNDAYFKADAEAKQAPKVEF